MRVAIYTRAQTSSHSTNKLNSMLYQAQRVAPDATIIQLSDRVSTKAGKLHPVRAALISDVTAGLYDIVFFNTRWDLDADGDGLFDVLGDALHAGKLQSLYADGDVLMTAAQLQRTPATVASEHFYGDPDEIVAAYLLLRSHCETNSLFDSLRQLDRVIVATARETFFG